MVSGCEQAHQSLLKSLHFLTRSLMGVCAEEQSARIRAVPCGSDHSLKILLLDLDHDVETNRLGFVVMQVDGFVSEVEEATVGVELL